MRTSANHRPSLAAFALALFVALLPAAAGAEPWTAKRTEFALAAIGETKVTPGATQWNILALGLFCGSGRLNPGRINLYVYGIGANRLATGRTVDATLDVDGAATRLSLRPVADIAVAAIEPELVRRLAAARNVSVLVADYVSPRPDIIDMRGASAAIRQALKNCFKP